MEFGFKKYGANAMEKFLEGKKLSKRSQLLNRCIAAVVFLLFSISSNSTFAKSAIQTIAEEESQFPGFKPGQYGWGAVFGQPFSVRYQRWTNWKRAWFADLGYQLDGFLSFDANYSFYLLKEDDRWKMKKKIGTLMFNAFTGALASVYVGKDKEEKARLGIRLGGALEYLIPESFWSVRLEMAPILYLSGSTAGGFQGGIGVVYYFDNPKIVKTSNPSLDDDAGESAQKPDFDEFDEFNDMSGTEDSKAKGSMVKPRSIREESHHPAPRQKKTEIRGGSGENGSTSSTRRKGTAGEKRKPSNQPRKVETKSKSRNAPKRSKTKDNHKSYRIEKFLEDKGRQNSDDIEL